MVIDRPELTGRILATHPGGTCVLSAAPGYGATTALVQAMAGSADRVLWMSLDSRVPPEHAGALLAAATGAHTADVDEVLDRIGSAGSCWLVVDGLDPQVHSELAGDLELVATRLPTTARLVIATHSRFGPVARAVTLDEAHLEFGTDEAFELISTIVAGLEIEDATRVIRAAEGWAGALVAGAAHLHQHGSGDWLPAGGATELFGEWFARLPPAQQDFLCGTAVLDELSAGPAAAVTGAPDAAATLLELEAAHAYVRPIPAPAGHDGRWWRRHGLLTAYLLQRSGSDRVACNSAAADWFIGAGDVNRAMHHLVASGRHRDAGEFLTRHESDLFSAGQADQMLHWYDQIAATAEDRIMHLLRVGWGQALSRDVRGADATLAGPRYGRTPGGGGHQPGCTPQRPRGWGGWTRSRRCALASASVSLDAGDPLAALDRATETARAAEAIGHHGDAVWASLIIARVHTVLGDYGAALRALAHARNLAVSETPDSTMAVPLDQAQALVHLAAGDAVRAERLIRRLPPSDIRSLLWARAGITRQPALARRTLEGIQTTMPRIEAGRHLLLSCVYLKTSRRMAQGHLRKAARIARADALAEIAGRSTDTTDPAAPASDTSRSPSPPTRTRTPGWGCAGRAGC